MRKFVISAASAAMVVGSTAAQAAPVADARTGSPVVEAEGLNAGAHLWLGLLAAGLLVFVLFQINDDENDDLPTSP